MNLKPLAFRVRPKSLDEVVGQEHIVKTIKQFGAMLLRTWTTQI